MKASVVSLLLILTTSIALSACSTDKTPPTTSYYHWANTYKLDAKLLKARPPQRLYIKWLDIGLHQGNIEVHQTQIDSLPKVPVTPVVFLDQRIYKYVNLKLLSSISFYLKYSSLSITIKVSQEKEIQRERERRWRKKRNKGKRST